jgi:hypothetical protein
MKEQSRMTRSTAPIALLCAVGLLALIGVLVVPATVEKTVYPDVVADGPTAPPVTTVSHVNFELALALLVIAGAAFAGAIVLAVLRRRRRYA